jgi:hypothetical protein
MRTTTMMALMLCALVQPVAAQTVYKCSVGGKVSYGEQPCADGKSSALALPPAPDHAAAVERLKQDKARLAAFQKDRKAVEARADREIERAARAAASTRQKCDRLRLQSKWADEDAARASKSSVAAARLKARRQAEALAVQCPA